MELDTATLVVNKLQQKSWTISFAESCTGGLAAARLIDVPAASSVINASAVTYSNESKTQYADVNPDTISKYSVESEEVALEMACGIAARNQANVGVGISGIAGPSGGTPEKPVGMVCFGFYIGGKKYSCTKYFGNIGRNEVRKSCVDFVFEYLSENI